jgi:hypothetical protein
VVHFVSLFANDNLSQILDPQFIDRGGKYVKELAVLSTKDRKDHPTMRHVECCFAGA